MTNVQLDNYINDLKFKINQQILDGISIDEIADKNNLKLNKLNNSIQNFEEDNFESFLINKAFSQNKDFISDIFDFDSDTSFIINIDEIYPSKVESIDEIFDKLKNDFIKFKKLNFVSETFESHKLDNNLIKVNDIFGSDIEEREIKLISKDIPASLVNNIFLINQNEITFSSDEDNVYFAKVNQIIFVNDKSEFNNLEILSELKNAFGNEIIKTKKISINDELINGLLSQYK